MISLIYKPKMALTARTSYFFALLSVNDSVHCVIQGDVNAFYI